MKKLLMSTVIAAVLLLPNTAVSQHWVESTLPPPLAWPQTGFSDLGMPGMSMMPSMPFPETSFLDMNGLLKLTNFSLKPQAVDPQTLGLVAKGEATEFVLMEFVKFLGKQTNSPLLRFVPVNMLLVDFAFDVHDMVRVYSGLAPPEELPIIASHLVMANQVLRGAPNISGTRTDLINTTVFDGALRMTTTGTQTVHTLFYSTASPIVARYGYNPTTDAIFRRITTSTTTRYYFNGAEWNRLYNQYGLP